MRPPARGRRARVVVGVGFGAR